MELEFLIGHLHPTLHPAYPDLQILFWDHNKDRMGAWASAFYSNATARSLVWGMGVH